MDRFNRRRISRRHRIRGQTLVEFALVFPLFIILLLGVVEFAFMFNATLAINLASRNASLIAAESGSNTLADCAILARIERDVSAPLALSQIQSVTIYKADRAGNPVSPAVQNVYTRTNSTPCLGYTPSSVPYTLGASTYPMGEAPIGGRCDILAGCSTTIPMDSIGVRITYRYVLKTPLGNLVSFLPGAAGGYVDFTWSNVMRMEPTL
jgi:Flp pilus assembly protein TadG